MMHVLFNKESNELNKHLNVVELLPLLHHCICCMYLLAVIGLLFWHVVIAAGFVLGTCSMASLLWGVCAEMFVVLSIPSNFYFSSELMEIKIRKLVSCFQSGEKKQVFLIGYLLSLRLWYLYKGCFTRLKMRAFN